MTTINAFFDESGKFIDQRVVVFGGVASQASRFGDDFMIDWARALESNGLTSLTMKDALNGRRALSEKNPALGSEKRTEALLPFIRCIRKHLDVVACVSVDADAFKELPQQQREIFNNPIYLAFLRTILKVIDDIPSDGIISFICDDEEETALPMYRLYRKVKVLNPTVKDRMRGISFDKELANEAKS